MPTPGAAIIYDRSCSGRDLIDPATSCCRAGGVRVALAVDQFDCFQVVFGDLASSSGLDSGVAVEVAVKLQE